MVQEATQKGYRLEIHCIGDATAETILNSFDKVPVGREKRPIMTHCQVKSYFSLVLFIDRTY